MVNNLKNFKKKGFTIIELVIILAIIAIVAAIAVPAYQGFISSAQIVNSTHKLKESIDIAKSEAVTLGSNVILCPSDNLQSATPSCSGSDDWNNGWMVMVPDNNDCNSDAGNIIKVYSAIHPDETINSTNNSNTSIESICFNRDAVPVTSTGDFSGLFNISIKNNPANNLCLKVGVMGKTSIVNSQQDTSCT